MDRAGYLAVSAAAVLWAVGGAYATRLMDQGASPVELTGARAWVTAAVLGLVALARPSKARRERVPLWLTVLFGLSIAGANFSYYAALSRLPVAVAITIQYSAPGLVVVWAAAVERRRPSARVLVALGAAVVGVALLAEVPELVAGGGLRLDGLGFLLAAMSAVAFASYMVSGEGVGQRLAARDAVLRGFIVSSVLWAIVQVFRGRPDTLLDPDFIPGVLFLAVATTIAPFVLFVWGLQRIRASDAAIVSTLEPLAAAVIAFVWLDQTLSLWQVAGAVLVIVGIALVQRERAIPPVPADVPAPGAAPTS